MVQAFEMTSLDLAEIRDGDAAAGELSQATAADEEARAVYASAVRAGGEGGGGEECQRRAGGASGFGEQHDIIE